MELWEQLLDKAGKVEYASISRKLIALGNRFKGKTQQEVADFINASQSIISIWETVFSKSGIEGLFDKPRPGHAPKLSKEQIKSLEEYLDANKTPQTQQEIAEWIKKSFNVEVSRHTISRILKTLGFSRQVPRPVHEKQNKEDVATWKEKAPLFYQKSGKSTKKRKSESTHSMKQDTDNKQS
jgi:transposase